jgi:hypothetical protein
MTALGLCKEEIANIIPVTQAGHTSRDSAGANRQNLRCPADRTLQVVKICISAHTAGYQ